LKSAFNFKKFIIMLLVFVIDLPAPSVAGDSVSPSIPESAGISSDRLQRIDEFFADVVNRGELSGSVVSIIRNGQPVYSSTFGWANIADRKPMRPDTIFRIFSMTKPITCAAAMILVEEGRLLLTDPVSRYVPGFKDASVYLGVENQVIKTEPIKRPINIRMLASHTSGMAYVPSPDQYPLLSERFVEADLGDPQQTLEHMVDGLASLPLIHQPGTTWEYSASSDVLARVVEVVSGQPFGDFIRARIFEPLGMSDTGYTVPEADWGRVATVYTRGDDGQLVEATDHHALRRDDYKNRRHHAGGHGLVSTSDDYGRFAQMLLNGGVLDGVRILSPASTELMRRDALGAIEHSGPYLNRDALGFGLCGSVIREPALHHSLGSVGTYSWSGAASTHFFVDPQESLVGVLMAQHDPPNPDQLFERFTNLVYQAVVD
jgi:CubicO group peptidase (beta-lactamase class C family)